MDKSLSAIDIIKNSVLEQFTGALNPVHVLISLGLSFLLGLFVWFIYRKTFAGVLYSRSFGLSLIMVTMITALIILPISSNIVLSLGMVGALSIVRFRTAVKDPMDTMFLFWGIALGICVGANFWAVAVMGAIIIGLVLVLISIIKSKGALPFLLVIHYHEKVSPEVRKMLGSLPRYKLKSKVLRNETVEMTVEVRMGSDEDMIVDKFLSINGVYDASLLSYQGEMIS